MSADFSHVRQMGSNRVHLLRLSDHTTHIWRDHRGAEFRHDQEQYESPAYRCIDPPATTLCGAKIGSRSVQVVVMRGWDPTEVCRSCRRVKELAG